MCWFYWIMSQKPFLAKLLNHPSLNHFAEVSEKVMDNQENNKNWSWECFFSYMICLQCNTFEEETEVESSSDEHIIEMEETNKIINLRHEESSKKLKSILKVKVDVHREDSSDEALSDDRGDNSEEEFRRWYCSSDEEVCTNPTPSLLESYSLEQYKDIHSRNETFTVDQGGSNDEVPKALNLTKNKVRFRSHDEIRVMEDVVSNRLRIPSTPVCFTTRNHFEELVYNKHPSAADLDASLNNLIEVFPEYEKEKKSAGLYKEINSSEKLGISDGNGLPEVEQKLPPLLRSGRRNRKYRKDWRNAIIVVSSSDQGDSSAS